MGGIEVGKTQGGRSLIVEAGVYLLNFEVDAGFEIDVACVNL